MTTTFTEGPRRTRALASWTAVSVAGAAVGNLVGGVLTQGLSWRWTLLINVPIGALTLLAATRILPADPAARREGKRLDVPGAVLATVGLAALLYGITGGQENGLAAPATFGPLLAGVLALVAFALVETRLAPAPLVPPGLFRLRAIVAGNAVMLLAGACFQAPMWYFLTFFMQRELHYTPLQTGLGFLPHTLITIAVGWRLTPLLMRRIPARTLIVLGAALAAVGFVWQSRMTAESGYLLGILSPAVVFTLGGGLFNTPLTTTVTSGVVTADAGAASGLMNTTKQLGGALGLAVLVGAATRPHGEVDYGLAFLASAGVLLLAALVALALPAHKDAPA
ncbi:MFS transporter [Streptomyces sp. CA-250714]|uniref:MFS transporter n=1 Tax=Streptomyces sp. CA-250714 TaxID=3240060 RepID=UPI003D8AFFCC